MADQKYMKLPARKKILRIRDTIYEDPGNPFANEGADGVSPMTTLSDQTSLPPPPRSSEESSASVDPFDINPFEDGAFAKVPATPKNSVAGDSSANTSNAPGYASDRRSKSIAVPLFPRFEDSGEYVAPRTLWRKGSMPGSHMSQPIPPSHDSWRDTRFSNFYDELVQNYGSEGKKL